MNVRQLYDILITNHPELDITIQQYELRFFNKTCFYCNQNSTMIDRLDPSVGWVSRNMVQCCDLCYTIKSTLNMTMPEYIEHCTNVSYKHKFDWCNRKRLEMLRRQKNY